MKISISAIFILFAVALEKSASAWPNTVEAMQAAQGRKISSKMDALQNLANVSTGSLVAPGWPPQQPTSTSQPPVSSFWSSAPVQGIFRTVLNMFTGKSDSESIFNQLAGLLMNIIDTLKQTFSARSAQARSIGQEDFMNDAMSAGLTFVKAYVKSIVSRDDLCVQKFLCQANRDAMQRNKKIGSLIGNAGSPAIGYLLERSNFVSSNLVSDASSKGRNGDNCEMLYDLCSDNL